MIVRAISAGLLLLALLTLAACEDGNGGPEGDASMPDGGRVTITLALLDDGARRSALYAIEQGIVTSDAVDLAVSYLTPSALIDATAAGQYDIIEASPLALVGPGASDVGLRLLSLGELDIDGTLLFTPEESDIAGPADLGGEALGVASLTSISTLEARFVLSERYGLSPEVAGGDVTFREAPGESQVALLRSNELAAAIPPAAATFAWTEDEEFAVLSHVAEEYAELTGTRAVQTALLTQGALATEQPAALVEVTRMLDAAAAYEAANRDQVIDAVTGGDETAREQVNWWWQAHELRYGQFSDDGLEAVGAIWEVARDLGDIESFPDPASLSFFAAEQP